MAKYANALLTVASLLIGVAVVELFLRMDDSSSAKAEFVSVVLGGRAYELIELPARIESIRNGVVVIGDSFVVGAKCGREENLTGQLARDLGRDDVINLGMNGTGVFSYARRLQDYIADHGAPRAVIVALYSNDIAFEAMMCPSATSMLSAGRFSADEAEQIGRFCAAYDNVDQLINVRGERMGGDVNAFLVKHSYVYRLLREVAAQLVVKAGVSKSFGRAAYPGSWADPDSLAFRVLEYGLRQLVAAARSAGSPLEIVFYPNVENLGTDSTVRAAYEVAAPYLRQALEVPVYSGYEAFIGNPAASGRMAWSLTDSHPSCLAHGIMARWLAGRTPGGILPTRGEPGMH